MVKKLPTIGILTLQGDFIEHRELLLSMAVPTQEVRSVGNLSSVSGLIIPGGESTVISQLLTDEMRGEIVRRSHEGSLPLYGTCAGAILLAKRITGRNPPHALMLMDITVERNAYGTQLQSFQAPLCLPSSTESFLATFIRAPRITQVGSGVEVLASHEGFPVLVKQRDILAGTFHPEVTHERTIHGLFLQLCLEGS